MAAARKGGEAVPSGSGRTATGRDGPEPYAAWTSRQTVRSETWAPLGKGGEAVPSRVERIVS